MFPPGKTDVALSRRGGWRISSRPIAVAVDAIRSAAPGVPVGMTLSMTDYQLAPGGEEKLERIRHHAEDVFLDATDGDDFLGVQAYSRQLIGPNGWAGYEDGVPVLDMGYEFYPASLGNCLRRAWSYTGGAVPLSVTENGIGTTDDDQRIDYVRQALDGSARRDRRGRRRPRVHVLVAARQLRVGPRLSAPVRHRRRRSHDVRPDDQSERVLALLGGGRERPRASGRGRSTAASARVGLDGVDDVVQSASGRSWPMPGMVISFASGTAAAVASPPLGVTRGSASPCSTRKGSRTPCSPSVRSGEARMAASCRAVPSGQYDRS